jgi:putative flavoprotein involved in K+ transport
LLEALVIGAGQAGLSASHVLRERGVDHLVLERGRVGETWRSQRWDGFVLNTPNWATRLPGLAHAWTDPDAFATRDEIVAVFDEYARDAPVRTETRATRVRTERDAWVVETEDDELRARNVIVAAGAFPHPSVPSLAREVPDNVLQMHSSEYRSPAQLPEGPVLVVGSAQSGCQIGEELLEAGRDVVLAAGRCGWFPRRYRGRDLIAWGVAIGMMDETVDAVPPEQRRGCNPALSGNDGGHDCHARTLADGGAALAGRIEGIDGGVARFASDLDQTLAFADQFAERFLRRVDEHIESSGVDAPSADPLPLYRKPAILSELDLRHAGAVVWATGYRPDFSWIDAPLRDDGWPVHVRGLSPREGLSFVGLPWLHKRKSALLLGVGEDAEFVVDRLVTTLPHRRRPRASRR